MSVYASGSNTIYIFDNSYNIIDNKLFRCQKRLIVYKTVNSVIIILICFC